VATTLLILRATTLLHHGSRSVAAATSLAVFSYAGHNLFGSFVAYGGGHWLDRAGPRVVFASDAALYEGDTSRVGVGRRGVLHRFAEGEDAAVPDRHRRLAPRGRPPR
jgi:hypothetical protein